MLGPFLVVSAPCRSRWPQGRTGLCVPVPALPPRSSSPRGRKLLRYPGLTIQVIQTIPGKKDELAFFSSDDGDVMTW